MVHSSSSPSAARIRLTPCPSGRAESNTLYSPYQDSLDVTCPSELYPSLMQAITRSLDYELLPVCGRPADRRRLRKLGDKRHHTVADSPCDMTPHSEAHAEQR